jgi:nucleoside-diphosphate-sugar epimerase
VVQAEFPEIGDIPIETTASDDIRSYHISSAKLQNQLGFTPQFTIEDGVRDLVQAFRAGLLPDSLSDPKYFNLKLMKDKSLK